MIIFSSAFNNFRIILRLFIRLDLVLVFNYGLRSSQSQGSITSHRKKMPKFLETLDVRSNIEEIFQINK